MNTALNEACVELWWTLYWSLYFITWKLLFGEEIFLVWEMSNFFAAEGDSPSIYRISPKNLEEGAGHSITGQSNKQD